MRNEELAVVEVGSELVELFGTDSNIEFGQDEMVRTYMQIVHATGKASSERGHMPGKILLMPHEVEMDSVLFLPAGRKRMLETWVPYQKGGGVVSVEEYTQHRFNELRMGDTFYNADGNEVNEVQYWFFYIIGNGGVAYPCMFRMHKTALKQARQLITQMRVLSKQNIPQLAQVWEMSVKQEKSSMNSYYVPSFKYTGEDVRKRVSNIDEVIKNFTVDKEVYLTSRSMQTLTDTLSDQ